MTLTKNLVIGNVYLYDTNIEADSKAFQYTGLNMVGDYIFVLCGRSKNKPTHDEVSGKDNSRGDFKQFRIGSETVPMTLLK